MAQSEFGKIKPVATYRLADMFQALTMDEKALQDTAKLAGGDWSPADPHGFAAASYRYEAVLDQLQKWREQGVELIEASAPFAGEMTDPSPDTIYNQIKDGRAYPVDAENRRLTL